MAKRRHLFPAMTDGGLSPTLFLAPCRNFIYVGHTAIDVPASMEGLIPLYVPARRQTVLATDAISHCREKMAALRHYYQATFEFQQIGLMYDLTNRLRKLGTPVLMSSISPECCITYFHRSWY